MLTNTPTSTSSTTPRLEARATVDHLYDGRSHVVVATWHGGPYIDLHWDYVSADTFEVINVWDDETNQPEIPFTQKALAGALRRFLANEDNDIEDYFDHTHRAGKWGPDSGFKSRFERPEVDPLLAEARRALKAAFDATERAIVAVTNAGSSIPVRGLLDARTLLGEAGDDINARIAGEVV